MRSMARRAGEKGFVGTLAAVAASFWAACLVAWPLGNNIWKFGPLNKSQAHALDTAILVVGLPPVFFFIALFYYIYRRRAAWRGQKGAESPSDLNSASS